MPALKKVLDKTPKGVYNICKKDGEGFDLSPIPFGRYPQVTFYTKADNIREGNDSAMADTLWPYYKLVRDTYLSDPSLFPSPPVFSGGFFSDIVFGRWPSDLDLFFNSYGMEKEEAEDNLCLFLTKLRLGFYELDDFNYVGLGSFRVFNCNPLPEARCHLQTILKDMGPPDPDDPLYVTKDFHYNHSKAALSVVGPAEIHYHGHAVAGWEHSIHVQYREGGHAKCRDKFFGAGGFKFVKMDEEGEHYVTKPKSDVKMPGFRFFEGNTTHTDFVWQNGEIQDFLQVNPVVNDPDMRPAGDPIGRPQHVLDAIRERQQQRNAFVNQFDPVRNNRRPVP